MNNLTSGPGGLSVIEALRRQISRTAMPEPARPSLRQRLAIRPRLALGGGLTAVAGITAAVVLAVGGGVGAPAAYAITDNSDGSVTITLNDLNAIPALNARLAADGVAIRAVPVVAGCVAPVQIVGQGGALQPARTLEAEPMPTQVITPAGAMTPKIGSLQSITVAPPAVPGRTLVIAVAPTGLESTAELIEGPAPSCAGEAQASAAG